MPAPYDGKEDFTRIVPSPSEIQRSHNNNWWNVGAGVAGALVTAATVKWGALPLVWNAKNAERVLETAGGAGIGGTLLSYALEDVGMMRRKVLSMIFNEIPAFYNRHRKGILAGSAFALGAAIAMHDIANDDNKNNASITTVTEAPNASSEATPSADTGTTTEGEQSTPTVSFVYNNGQPLPEGHCIIDTPIAEKATVDQAKQYQELLSAAGFYSGPVDGEIGTQTGDAWDQAQIAAGIPEEIALNKDVRMSQEDCYEVASKVPALAGLWVQG